MYNKWMATGISVIVLALASAASAAAQSPNDGPRPGKNLFNKVDANGDGIIDQKEFAAAMKFLKKHGAKKQPGERGAKARGPEGRRGMKGMMKDRGPKDDRPGPQGICKKQGPNCDGTAQRKHQRKHRREAFKDDQERGKGPAWEGRGRMKQGPGQRGPNARGPKGQKAGPKGGKQLDKQIEARVQKRLEQRLPKMIRKMIREALNEQGPMGGKQAMRNHRGGRQQGHWDRNARPQRGHRQGPMMQGPGRGQGRGMDRPCREQRQMHRGDWGRQGRGEGQFRRGEGRRHHGEGLRQGRQNRFGPREGWRQQREGRRNRGQGRFHRGEGRRPFDMNRGWQNGPEQLPGCPFGMPMWNDDAGPDGDGPAFDGPGPNDMGPGPDDMDAEPMDIGPDELDEPVGPAEAFDEI